MENILCNFLLAALIISATAGSAFAREPQSQLKKVKSVKTEQKAAVCKRAQSSAELSVNNVRARINGYGNMWYDGSIAQYHLPKNGNACPLYCAALWVGGTDVNEQLRIAALTFGSSGDDFWPGPLQLNTAYVDLPVCNQYDRHYIISKQQVQNHMAHFIYTEAGVEPNPDNPLTEMEDVIENWPAHGNTAEGFSKYLAPFFDADGNGEYNPEAGDYPYYDFDNDLCPQTRKSNGLDISVPTMETTEGIVHGGILSDQVLKGDQTIWWIFNDMGNVHTETDGQPIGLEIRAQAFAFSTNDDINNMTFYSYEIINRSTYTLKDTYFSQWVDADLGYAYDDYVGCDVKRGLGYCYNGDEQDGPGSATYSGIPPAVGIDFFQGPYMDPDGKDNPKIDIDKIKASGNGVMISQLAAFEMKDANGNTIYDTFALTQSADIFYPDGWYFKPGDSIGNCAINGVNFGNGIVDDERFGMRRFVYYNNGGTAQISDPGKATDYYNYLKGNWKNSQRMTFGGNGFNDNTTNVVCDFMFPGDSDPWKWGTNGVDPVWNGGQIWTDKTAGNQPGDRRFMQSAGPFTLRPGALNYITVGIPFAQAASGNAWSSVELLREVDDVCQALFENCFKVLDGPDAPTITVQELNKEIILYLSYDNVSSNNYNEKYSEVDPSITRSYSTTVDGVATTGTYTDEERSYVFEGYQIYQLVDANASISDINDVTKARLVAQCDIENYYDEAKTLPIAKLVNFETNSATGILSGTVKVDGANSGIQHVFRITSDQFATGSSTALVNNKEYYFVAVAYAHNRYKEYSQTEAAFLDGQKEPYLSGRKDEWGNSIKPVTAIPHDPSAENGGTVIQAEFEMRPNITRIEGYGNGGNQLMLTQESIEELMGAKGVEGKGPGKFTFRSGSISRVSNPCIIAHPKYEQNYGPIDVKVIDPLNIKPGQFIINFVNEDGSSIVNEKTRWYITNAIEGQPVYPGGADTIYSDFAIGRQNEQLFLDLGIAVSLKNADAPADPLQVSGMFINGSESEYNYCTYYGNTASSNAILGSSITYEDPYKQWLYGVNDYDGAQMYNWIRAGIQFASNTVNDFTGRLEDISLSEAYLDEDYFRRKCETSQEVGSATAVGVDKSNIFEDVVSGMWAPYGLVSTLDFHPGFNYSHFMPPADTIAKLHKKDAANAYVYGKIRRSLLDNTYNQSLVYNDLTKLPSVRIVFTADTTKWTRCPVLEMCDDYTQAEGKARKFQKRKHLSVDKLGRTIEDLGIAANPSDPTNPAYIDAYGMGWFPGYAISLTTGERLNIMFGEDSRYIQFNGRDMLWNPVDEVMNGTENYVMGGRHFIYVLNATTLNFPGAVGSSSGIHQYETPSYDAGAWANSMIKSLDRLLMLKDKGDTPKYYYGIVSSEGSAGMTATDKINSTRDSSAMLFASAAWVNIPLVNKKFAFNYPGHNSKLNAGAPSDGIACDVTVDIQVNQPYGRYMSYNATDAKDCGEEVKNDNMPRYMFDLSGDIATLTEQATKDGASDSKKNEILEAIAVVPNPYYSYSTYETLSQLETKVRFTNLPANSVISIYTVDGTLVRRLGPTPANTTTYDWDLHNHMGIPIAGGMYLIHVSVPNIGERVIKWFGTMRPVDLNSFQF
ncbi:MAG: hypothetical protein KBT04_02030 [Bacteroidales bacterium]|nr:hypothetical protein [Candidatus Colimorpha onthohippi]